MIDGCGENPSELLEKQNPFLCLERTLKDCLQKVSKVSQVTLKEKVTKSGHIYWQLQTVEPYINENVYSSLGIKIGDRLPTPQAMDAMGARGLPALHKLMNGQRKGRTKHNTLKDVAVFGLYYHSEICQQEGQISPLFVEWMMGFPLNWTKRINNG